MTTHRPGFCRERSASQNHEDPSSLLGFCYHPGPSTIPSFAAIVPPGAGEGERAAGVAVPTLQQRVFPLLCYRSSSTDPRLGSSCLLCAALPCSSPRPPFLQEGRASQRSFPGAFVSVQRGRLSFGWGDGSTSHLSQDFRLKQAGRRCSLVGVLILSIHFRTLAVPGRSGPVHPPCLLLLQPE